MRTSDDLIGRPLSEQPDSIRMQLVKRGPANAKLTKTEVRVIRVCMAEDSTLENRKFLARYFGVHHDTIRKIHRGDLWQGVR